MEKNKFQKFMWFLPKLATYTFCIFLTILLLLIILVFPVCGHALQKDFSKYNLIIFIFSIVLAFIILIVNKKILIKFNFWDKYFKKILIIGSVLLFILQLFIVVNKLFVAGWDVQKLYFTTEFDEYYFSQYPNNLFLKGFFNIFSYMFNICGLSNLFITAAINIFPWSNIANSLTSQNAAEYLSYFFFIIVNCVLVNISTIFIALIIKNIKNSKLAIFTYIFCFVFLGLMPWILVPYSDIFTLFFTLLILYLYICQKNKLIKWVLIFAFTVISFNIKPTAIFITCAILFYELCKAIYFHKTKFYDYIKNNIKTFIAIVLSISIALCIVASCKCAANINTDENKQFSATHYLMMGLNRDSQGFYNDYDITISADCANPEQRQAKNIEEINNRIKDLGPLGVIKLYAQKSMANYSDATFMWKMDAGPGFSVLNITNNTFIDKIYDNYGFLAQILWFAILLGCCFSFLIKNNKIVPIICIALLAHMLFLAVFECGARYIIQYLPFYIILSSLSWANISAIINKKFLKKE